LSPPPVKTSRSSHYPIGAQNARRPSPRGPDLFNVCWTTLHTVSDAEQQALRYDRRRTPDECIEKISRRTGRPGPVGRGATHTKDRIRPAHPAVVEGARAINSSARSQRPTGAVDCCRQSSQPHRWYCPVRPAGLDADDIRRRQSVQDGKFCSWAAAAICVRQCHGGCPDLTRPRLSGKQRKSLFE